MNLKFLILLAFVIISCQKSLCQNKLLDTITDLSYKELKTAFFESMEDKAVANLYVQVHLDRAKDEKDIIKIADSYLYKSYINDFPEAIKYSDSIIDLTINERHIYYPALGFMIKGYHYYNNGWDKEAIDEYIKADKYAVLNNNFKQQIQIKQFIGGIKYNFGNYKEALDIFKQQIQFIKSQPNYKDEFATSYLIVLDDISKTFLRGKETDSALFYTKEGITESLKFDERVMYKRFLLTSGACYYYKNNYDRALDSLNKLQIKIKNPDRLAMCLYYKAKIYENSDLNLAVINFKKVDSIYRITENPFIELRDVYKTLFNYYKTYGTQREQLESVVRLIEVDSILDLNQNYAEVEIIKKYDIPKLKEEKKILESTIKVNSKRRNQIYFFLGFIILFSLFFLIKLYFTQKNYKDRYNAIMIENDSSNSIKIKSQKLAGIDVKELNITDSIVEDILIKLDQFENSNDYLKNGITLNSVAKSLDTNSSYLSKIINHYKGQSFSKYLNNLRVQYAIKKLKSNKVFRNYTISAIAQDVGFNTAESFSKSFFKEKGIYPSYFIKQLNKS